MTVLSRRIFLVVASGFAGASALSGTARVAEAAGVSVVKISQDMPAEAALDTLMLMSRESKTKGPVFVIAYDDPNNPEYRKYQQVMNYVFKENRYSGTVLLVDLRAHADLPLGHAFEIEKEKQRVTLLATAIVNGEISRNSVTTSFNAKGKSGKSYNVTIQGIAITQEGRSDDAFKITLYEAFTKLYTVTSGRFQPK